MRKFPMKRLAILLSVVMVVSLFANVNWTVRAEEPGNNQYVLHYRGDGNAAVKLGENTIDDSSIQSYLAGETLNFTLIEPDNLDNCTPIVEIVVHGESEEVYRTDSDEPAYLLTISNEGTLSFTTPSGGAPFEMIVWWSVQEMTYDTFWGTEGKPILVEIECCGDGQIGLDGVDEADKAVLYNWTKARFVENTDTVVLTWSENSVPRRISVEGGSEYTEFNGTSQSVTISPDEGNFCYICVEFDDQGGPEFENNKYRIFYDDNGDAQVTVGGAKIVPFENNDFEKNETLNFTLTPPESRQGQTPIVEIVVHDGDAGTGTPETVWRSDSEEGNKITLVNNTFSFTPTSEKGFEVFIDWSEYDAFVGNDAYPVVVQVDCQGTIGFDGVLPENKIHLNNFTKVRVAEDTTSLTLTWEANAVPSQIKVEVNEQSQNEEERWLILDEDDFSNNSCSIPLTALEENGNKKHFYYVCVEYSGNQGGGNNQYNFTRLQQELDKIYFAFGDVDGDASVSINDLKYGVMRTLYDGFRVNEGRYQSEGAALGLKQDNKQGNTDLNENMQKLLSLANVESMPISGDTITAKDKNGLDHTFSAYQVTITINALYENRADLTNFPAESEKVALDTPIVLTAKAYLIDMTNSDEQVIIKVKNEYFVRDAHSENGNTDDLEDFEGLNARALILVADYGTKEDIVVFGNYATMNETLSDETADRFFASGFGTGDGVKYLGDKFVVMKPGFLGVTINGTGETNMPLAWSVESSLSIAETGVNSGKDTETDIYFGFDSVEIAPVTSTKVGGLGVDSISTVEVLDGIPENAVRVDAAGNGKYTVHFLSDYYDTVRIKVTYNTTNGTENGIMTLNRVGIMIQGGMTAGDSHTVNIFHGHNQGETLDQSVYNDYKAANPDKTHGDYKYAYYATYYYPTDSNAISADTSLFVTYTYADRSVERKLLESYQFTAAGNGNVAMSDYILYMGDGSNAPVKVEAIAIPNVNPDGTINGAKLGAGKGVEGTFNFED